MLLSTISHTKRNLIAGVAALAVVTAGTSPALAWGRNEQQFLAGVLTTIAVGAVINQANKRNQVARQPVYSNTQPVVYAPAPTSIYSTPIGVAFNGFTDNEQRRIQSTLSAQGYYHGTIDGSFGPGTYNALALYASRTGKTELLSTRSGSYGLLDSLLF